MIVRAPLNPSRGAERGALYALSERAFEGAIAFYDRGLRVGLRY